MLVASDEYNFSCMTSAIIDFEATEQSGRVQFNVSPSFSQSVKQSQLEALQKVMLRNGGQHDVFAFKIQQKRSAKIE